MLMNNESDHLTAYRRLSDSTPSPILRRSKSVRASFRMLGSRWKTSSSSGSKVDNGAAVAGSMLKNVSSTRDVVSERFGKDFNRNVKQPMTMPAERVVTATSLSSSSSSSASSSSTSSSMPLPSLPLKAAKTKFFHAFAKENVSERHIQYEIPKNVAPKAAALLQIPVLPSQQQSYKMSLHAQQQYAYQRHQPHPHPHHHYHHQHPKQKPKKHDLIKIDGNFGVHLDRNTCDLIANSNQFALLNSLTEKKEKIHTAHHIQDIFKPATVRRAPYWLNNRPLKYSKTFVLFTFILSPSCIRFTCFSSASIVTFSTHSHISHRKKVF